MPAQPCRHLLLLGMAVTEWKKKNMCIHRYQVMETEGQEVNCGIGSLVGFLADTEKAGILIEEMS